MTGDVRPEVIDRAVAEYVEMCARMQGDVMRMLDDLELTTAERVRLAVEPAHGAIDDLHDAGALREPRGLLDLTRRQVGAIVERGLALLWLEDQLVNWSPDVPLVDALKILPPKRIAYLARNLRRAGVHDLDELSPPTVMNPGDVEVNDDDDG